MPVSPRTPATPAAPHGSRPTPLVLAASVVSFQAAGLFGFGLWELWRSTVETPTNRAVAQGSTAYFLVLGALVGVVAVGMWRGRGWTHGAAVFLQLIALPLAWTMTVGGFWVGAALVSGTAVAALVALVSPAGRTALGR